MLADFIVVNRDVLVARTQARLASASTRQPVPEQTQGVPDFLEQLSAALRHAESTGALDRRSLSLSAGRHGRELLRSGLTIAQVVRDYGALCQTITELAVEKGAPIPLPDLSALNGCFDDAIAEAVTQYSLHRERALEEQGTERLGVFAHELRNLLNTAMLSFDRIKTGGVPTSSRAGLVHDRCLVGLRELIDRSLAEVRLDAGLEHRERIVVADFVEEVQAGSAMQARSRGLLFSSEAVDRTLVIEGDRQVLASAVVNLLQNAFKFTLKHGKVSLKTYGHGDRILFDVQDECGGLPPGKADELFRPFHQRGADRSGVGLGLAICHKAAQSSAGRIAVRDIPGQGCVFTLDLPRAPELS